MKWSENTYKPNAGATNKGILPTRAVNNLLPEFDPNAAGESCYNNGSKLFKRRGIHFPKNNIPSSGVPGAVQPHSPLPFPHK